MRMSGNGKTWCRSWRVFVRQSKMLCQSLSPQDVHKTPGFRVNRTVRRKGRGVIELGLEVFCVKDSPMPIFPIGKRGAMRKSIAAIHVYEPGFLIQHIIRDMNMTTNHTVHSLRGGIGDGSLAEIADEVFADFLSQGGKIKLPCRDLFLHVEIALDNPVKCVASSLIPLRISTQIGRIKTMAVFDRIARDGWGFLSVPGFKDGLGDKVDIANSLPGQQFQSCVMVAQSPCDLRSSACQRQNPVENAIVIVWIKILFMLLFWHQSQKIIKFPDLIAGALPLLDHLVEAMEQELEINHIPDHIKRVQSPGGVGAGQKNILLFNPGIGMEKMPV